MPSPDTRKFENEFQYLTSLESYIWTACLLLGILAAGLALNGVWWLTVTLLCGIWAAIIRSRGTARRHHAELLEVLAANAQPSRRYRPIRRGPTSRSETPPSP